MPSPFARSSAGRSTAGFTARACARAIVALAFACALAGQRPADARDPSALGDVLARYRRAMTDDGVPPATRYEATGTLSGVGLAGTYHEWFDGERERLDSNLGPRSERTLKLGDRFWLMDENGSVRQLTGVLARRARTQAFIDTGAFANDPAHCELRSRIVLAGKRVDVVDVTAEGGDTEALYLDATTGLPMRLVFDDDDGTSTIELSDWRTIAGHRFPFKSVTSDGEHAFDTTQVTGSVTFDRTPDDATFAPLVGRQIEMSGPQTLPLEFRNGHFYAPARIDGHDFTFLLDSGSQNVVLDRRVATELKLPTAGALEASGTKRTGGLQIALVDELDIGSGTLRKLVAATIDLHGSTSGAFRIDGILGYPFFAMAQVRLDAAARTMTFGPPGSFPASGERLPAETDRAIPEVRLGVDGRFDAPFIIDTGNAAEVLLYKPFVDRHAGIVPFTQNVRNSYGIGGAAPSYRTSLDRLDVGSTSIFHAETDVMQATRGAFADRYDAGNVGLGVLKNFVVTFDLASGALYVEHGANFDDGSARN